MTPICDRIIDHPSAWTPATIGSKEGLKHWLTEEELAAIEVLLERTRHMKPQEVTRADFDHPTLNRLLDRVRDVIMNGRGILIVSGITPTRFSEEQFERIYWGFGTHLGVGAVQSANGDRLGYVQADPKDVVMRGYRSPKELHMHTDSYEVIGLMCVRRAKSGGMSGLAPSLSIHNEILQKRPDLLPPLYRGFRIASEEARFSSKAITDDEMPVFSWVDGKLSCMYEPSHMKNAAELLGGMPDDLAEALDYFDGIANREDMALRFLLEPGDMMLWHNYLNLHSRTAFEDDPRSPRKLLRLWLSVPNGRPADPRFKMRAETYERIYREKLAQAS
ncbi:MAG: TauD/TfdA family dioxygenase [Burkholderiales bacterium]